MKVELDRCGTVRYGTGPPLPYCTAIPYRTCGCVCAYASSVMQTGSRAGERGVGPGARSARLCPAPVALSSHWLHVNAPAHVARHHMLQTPAPLPLHPTPPSTTGTYVHDCFAHPTHPEANSCICTQRSAPPPMMTPQLRVPPRLVLLGLFRHQPPHEDVSPSLEPWGSGRGSARIPGFTERESFGLWGMNRLWAVGF